MHLGNLRSRGIPYCYLRSKYKNTYMAPMSVNRYIMTANDFELHSHRCLLPGELETESWQERGKIALARLSGTS